MGEDFLNEYGEVAKQVKATLPVWICGRLIRDKLNGQIMVPMFNKIGRAFTSYYYGEPDSPNFPRDIENYALEYLGPEKYYSDEFQFKAPLFIPLTRTTTSHGKGDRGTLHQLAGTGLRRGHAGTLRTG